MSIYNLNELIKYIRSINDQDAEDFIIFIACTGRRISELLPPWFTWDNYNGKEVVLYPLKRGVGEVIISIGDNESHPLKVILDRRKSEGFEHHFPYTRHQLYNRIIKKYFPKVGLKGYSFMSIRKMVATEIENVYDASALLGHTSIRTTEGFYKKPKIDRISKVVINLLSNIND